MRKKIKKSYISIIIVNYNNAKYLTRSVNSALKQSYKSKEIIVVDDNSLDNSLEVLDKFKKKIKIIKNTKKTSEGSFNQINSYYKGFIKSKGNYIFFLDSDDYYTKDKVKFVMKEFEKQDQKIIFDLAIWKYKKKSIKKKFKQKKNINSSWPRFTPQSCISLRRDYAYETFKNLKVKKFETIWFDFRLASYTFIKNRKIHILNKYLTFYRRNSNSASSKFKLFSKNWWYRRGQAHEFILYLENKFHQKNKKTFDLYITKIVNFFI